jgi:hypothetical protein
MAIVHRTRSITRDSALDPGFIPRDPDADDDSIVASRYHPSIRLTVGQLNANAHLPRIGHARPASGARITESRNS